MNRIDISTDKAKLDLALIHRILSEQSTWALGIPYSSAQCSIPRVLALTWTAPKSALPV